MRAQVAPESRKMLGVDLTLAEGTNPNAVLTFLFEIGKSLDALAW
jgi:hypothetical protein